MDRFSKTRRNTNQRKVVNFGFEETVTHDEARKLFFGQKEI